jgi:hypothetical protein
MSSSRKEYHRWIMATIVESGNRRFWGWTNCASWRFFRFYFFSVRGTKLFFSLSGGKILQCSPYSRQLPKACLARLAVMQRGIIHVHIHNVWRRWNTLDVFDNEVEAILDGSTASTTAICGCCPSGSAQNSGQLQKAWLLIVTVKW